MNRRIRIRGLEDLEKSFQALNRKMTEPLRGQIDAVFEPLRRQVAEALEPLLSRFAAIADLPGFRALLEQFQESWPPNWDESTPDQVFDMVRMSENTGICIAWLPRIETLWALMQSQDPRDTLRRAADNTIDDCRTVLQAVNSPELSEYRDFASKALDAYADGHPEAALAMASNTLTTFINIEMGRANLTDAGLDFMDWESKPFTHFRRAVVLVAVGKALEKNWPHRGDPPPDTFNRHVATHGVSAQQYTEAHSLTALMALVAALRERQEELDESVRHLPPTAGPSGQ